MRIHRNEHRILVLLNLFLGITAALGGLALVTGRAGIPEEYLAGSPFSSYIIPGLALLFLVGGAGLIASILLRMRDTRASLFSVCAGIAILVYETVEYGVIGGHWLQGLYMLVGVLIIILSLRLWLSESRGHHATLARQG